MIRTGLIIEVNFNQLVVVSLKERVKRADLIEPLEIKIREHEAQEGIDNHRIIQQLKVCLEDAKESKDTPIKLLSSEDSQTFSMFNRTHLCVRRIMVID